MWASGAGAARIKPTATTKATVAPIAFKLGSEDRVMALPGTP